MVRTEMNVAVGRSSLAVELAALAEPLRRRSADRAVRTAASVAHGVLEVSSDEKRTNRSEEALHFEPRGSLQKSAVVQLASELYRLLGMRCKSELKMSRSKLSSMLWRKVARFCCGLSLCLWAKLWKAEATESREAEVRERMMARVRHDP